MKILKPPAYGGAPDPLKAFCLGNLAPAYCWTSEQMHIEAFQRSKRLWCIYLEDRLIVYKGTGRRSQQLYIASIDCRSHSGS